MNNSELLFIYDAKMCNPNGDPDDENRPRMDYERQRNLVSDVRLKRYIRDYLEDMGYGIFVSKQEDKVVDADTRLKDVVGKGKVTKDDLPVILDKLIDVRLFGATMPIKADESGRGGSSIALTGPVQFTWCYSLNKVNLVDSNGITSHFSSRTENQQGAMGKDYRVYYSLLAFHGIISAKRSQYTKLKDTDIELLDQAILKAIPLQATRSKIGQYPRLYVRVEYEDDQTFLGDFRDMVSLESAEGLRDTTEARLKASLLAGKLISNEGRIAHVYWWQDDELTIADSRNGKFDGLFEGEINNKLIRL